MTGATSEPPGPRVVALGGGHGLAASLSALRRITDQLTAIVTVADDGGSSGRLRDEFGCLPPGDLRMALAALCGDDDWGRLWSRVVQHRFSGQGPLHGHAVGNLLIVALWQLLDDSVAGLDQVGQLLGAHGRVLPASLDPIDIEADVAFPAPAGSSSTAPELCRIRGQAEVATTTGRVVGIHLDPTEPRATPEAIKAVLEADWLVLGPGSWFTSVIPHLLVPELAAAITATAARTIVALNLTAQPGETAGFAPEQHLEVLSAHAPELVIDVVLADSAAVSDPASLASVAKTLGAQVVLAPLGSPDGRPAHDPELFAAAFDSIVRRGRIAPWR